ncbi:hypothetical protein VTP01DRAFT_8549 [Rhizomucor pusillus]|uniref:uncharacterized protein n=1 Tax=Rhizomucor pusillus TaxID=4840 RepID=UPI003742FBC3
MDLFLEFLVSEQTLATSVEFDEALNGQQTRVVSSSLKSKDMSTLFGCAHHALSCFASSWIVPMYRFCY